MAKKQFKAESKRILDLMINSIYTHREIFLRELISNASDAEDKLAYLALTDHSIGLTRKDLKIVLQADREARTLTISDNGVGMTREELESNLGTIARSGSRQFKQDLEKSEAGDSGVDIIGQFGVGFYSAFMVADRITVRTRACGQEEGLCWESAGADGYTVTPCDKDGVGTDVILHLKPDGEEERFSQYLEQDTLARLVKKYSDYIRFPIVMEMVRSRPKAKAGGDGEEAPQWEEYVQLETLNSMVPIWQRKKGDVTQEEYDLFYQDKFSSFEPPLSTLSVQAEGVVSYQSLLFVPGSAPYDFYTREYEKGLQLYSSGVLIMDKCPDLLPDYFRFVRGVVDTPDLSLNISREMLQHTRQLKVISANLEKKIKAELLRLQKDEPEKYLRFWSAFGAQIKYGAAGEFGAHKDLLSPLLMFLSSHGEGMTSLAGYVSRMKEGQPYLYYAVGDTAARAAGLPQAERILDQGYEILYLTDEVDEFVMQTLGSYEDKLLKSINDQDALPETEEEKKAAQEQTEENRPVLDFLKEVLGERIKEARISRILKSCAVCIKADGPVSLDMEKYIKKMDASAAGDMQVERVLEVNPAAPAFLALKRAVETDRPKAELYAKLLYSQALLLADLPLEDAAEYHRLVCSLME